MIVTAHGNVDDYCAARGMVIGARYEGEIENYVSPPVVLVTDQVFEKNDFYALKLKMLHRKVELVSVWHDDNEMNKFVMHLSLEKKTITSAGRPKFGCKRVAGEIVEDPKGMAVVRRIFELRDAGFSYAKITEDDGVCYPDGRRMGVSVVQIILSNRDWYEKQGWI